jgi:hypothetical protein
MYSDNGKLKMIGEKSGQGLSEGNTQSFAKTNWRKP